MITTRTLLLSLTMISCLGASACERSRPEAGGAGAATHDAAEDAPPAAAAPAPPASAACLPLPEAPEVVARDGGEELLRWELPYRPEWDEGLLPQSAALTAHRQAIERAGGDLYRPASDMPEMKDARTREVWRREFLNQDLAYSGAAGTIRPIHCLEALLFARQAERHDPIEHPAEFIGALLTRESADGALMARVYFASGAEMFPKKSVYPFEAASADVKQGWQFVTFLHNHTILRSKERPVLGPPVPSTNDVQLARALVEESGLQEVRVTNGFYTIAIPASHLTLYASPPE